MKSFIAVALVVALAALALADVVDRREAEIEITKAEAAKIQQSLAGIPAAKNFLKGVQAAYNSNLIKAAKYPYFQSERVYVANILSAYEHFGEAVEQLAIADKAYNSDGAFHAGVAAIKSNIGQRMAQLSQDLKSLTQ